MIFPVKTTKNRSIMYLNAKNALSALQSVAEMLTRQKGERYPTIIDGNDFLYFVFEGETYSVSNLKSGVE